MNTRQYVESLMRSHNVKEEDIKTVLASMKSLLDFWDLFETSGMKYGSSKTFLFEKSNDQIDNQVAKTMRNGRPHLF